MPYPVTAILCVEPNRLLLGTGVGCFDFDLTTRRLGKRVGSQAAVSHILQLGPELVALSTRGCYRSEHSEVWIVNTSVFGVSLTLQGPRQLPTYMAYLRTYNMLLYARPDGRQTFQKGEMLSIWRIAPLLVTKNYVLEGGSEFHNQLFVPCVLTGLVALEPNFVVVGCKSQIRVYEVAPNAKVELALRLTRASACSSPVWSRNRRLSSPHRAVCSS